MPLGTPSHSMTHEDVGSNGVCGMFQGHRHLLAGTVSHSLTVFHTRTWARTGSLGRDRVLGPSVAMAPTQPTSSRAMAPVTTLACVPFAPRRWERVPSRTWAFPRMS